MAEEPENETEMASPRRWIAGIIIIGFLAGLIVAVTVIMSENRERTSQHTIDYAVTISFDTTVNNLTIIIPLASVGSSLQLGDDLANGSGYGIPVGWALAPISGNGSPMLMISVPQFVPEYAPYPEPINEDEEPGTLSKENGMIRPLEPAITATVADIHNESGYRARTLRGTNETAPLRNFTALRPVTFGIRTIVPATIDTREPFGREPLLYPKENLFATACTLPVIKTARCFAYTSPLYIGYQSGEPQDIEISVSVHGSNEWWELGWSSNSYTDTIIASRDGGGDGWILAEGTVITGNGRY